MESAARASVDAPGRLVIPKRIREAAGIVPGVPLDVRFHQGRVEIEPASAEIEAAVGADGLPVAVAKEPPPRLEESQVRKTLEDARERRDPSV